MDFDVGGSLICVRSTQINYRHCHFYFTYFIIIVLSFLNSGKIVLHTLWLYSVHLFFRKVYHIDLLCCGEQAMCHSMHEGEGHMTTCQTLLFPSTL